MTFASGLLDLMGVHPVAENRIWQDPWAAIDALVADEPEHPFERLNQRDIRLAFDELLGFLDEAGLSYFRDAQRNSAVLTPVGTIKHTYAVPETMWAGARALEDKIKCLLIDFEGMKDYSARQIAATLKGVWPGLRAVRLAFPETVQGHEIFTVRMAQTLELAQSRKKLAQSVHPHVKDALAVGMPAVLGLRRTRQILADLKGEMASRYLKFPPCRFQFPASASRKPLKPSFHPKAFSNFCSRKSWRRNLWPAAAFNWTSAIRKSPVIFEPGLSFWPADVSWGKGFMPGDRTSGSQSLTCRSASPPAGASGTGRICWTPGDMRSIGPDWKSTMLFIP